MKKSYKVKVNQTADKSEVVNVSADKAQATKIPAVAGARYQLIDNNTGLAPDNIRAKRIGKDLGVIFEGRSEPDLLITDYYENTATGFNALIGEAESGAFHAYIPESANGATSIGVMADGSAQVGMALGGEQIAASGAAVGTLVAAAGFSPLWALPLALLGAGGGGGSDAAAPVATGPKVSASKLHQEDDTGVSNTDNITPDNTPRIVVDADAGATVTVKINGKEYAGKEVSPGRYEIPVTDPLPDGLKTFEVIAKNAAGGTTTFAGTPFVVDTSSANNYVDPDKTKPTEDPNNGITVDIKSITTDTGSSANDFYTSDNTLLFQISLSKGFAKNGDMVELKLVDSKNTVIASDYVELENGKVNYEWDVQGLNPSLEQGRYKVTAKVIDKAGNPVGASDEQIVVIDKSSENNVDPKDPVDPIKPDPNSKATVDITSITEDRGVSGSDFTTNDNLLTYGGTVSNFTANGDKVKVELLEANGTTVIATAYVDVTATTGGAGIWIWAYETLQLDGQYTVRATIVDAADNRVNSAVGGQDTQVVIVDTDGGKNQPDGSKNPNTSAKVDITIITTDSGIYHNDFITNDKTLTYSGTVTDFTANGDKVLVELLNSNNQVIATNYADATVSGTTGSWKWAYETEQVDGQYTIRATVVDKAGNRVNANGAQDSQVLTIKSAADEKSKNNKATVEITKITTDTGSDSDDFITSDHTLTFTGEVDKFVSNLIGEKVKLELLSADNQILTTKYVDPSNNAWEWVYETSLPDANYSLKATIVDIYGNQLNVNGGQDVQAIAINSYENLQINIEKMNEDTGYSQSDFLTKDRLLTFTGSVGSAALPPGAKLLVEIVDQTGKVVAVTSNVSVGSDGKWTFDSGKALGVSGQNTQYLLKALVLNDQGAIVKSTDHAFVIDLNNPDFGVKFNRYNNDISELKFDANEEGYFVLTKGTDNVDDDVKLDINQPSISNVSGSYATGKFGLKFYDAAGNVSFNANFSDNKDYWNLNGNVELTYAQSSGNTHFSGNELVGSIGKIYIEQEIYDLSGLSLKPVVDAVVVHNYVDLLSQNHTLNLTTSDVLALGVKNSFVSDGYRQLRIDGDDGDTVNLDNLLGSTQYDWVDHSVDKTIGNQSYHVYTNDALNLEVLVQQPIHIYLV